MQTVAAPCAATSLVEDFDLQPQLRPQSTLDSLALSDYTTMRDIDPLMDQRQWDLIQTLSESLATNGAELKGGEASSPDEAHGCEEAEDTPTLINPPTEAVAAAICLMVEDPYFDGPASPPAPTVTTDTPEWPEDWTVSKAISPPAVHLQGQTLEPPASGEPRRSLRCPDVCAHEVTSAWLCRSH